MLVYKEYFNAGVSIYISHITIFTFANTYLRLLHTVPSFDKHYQMSPLSPQRQSPLTATWRFQQQFLLDEIPLQIALEAVHLTLSPQIFPVEVKSRSMLHHGSVGASSK